MNLIRYFEEMELELKRSIKKRELLISRCPDGSLHCYRNGKNFTWYLVRNICPDKLDPDDINPNGDELEKSEPGITCRRDRSVISKKDEALATRLAVKGFNKDALIIERKMLKAVQLFLRYYPVFEPGQRYIERNEEYLRLSKCNYKNYKYSEQEWEWMNAQRPVPQERQDELTVPTILDYKVRSKSEADYIYKLVEYGIVFRYEWPTKLEGYFRPIFPDFRILNPKTGEEYILEHFGIMDDDTYVEKNADKGKLYILNAWLPGKNLFYSYETKARPFTVQDAEEIIRTYFSHLIR